MGKNKICNQTFVKDSHRDKQYIGTLRCMICDEQSHINLKFPCTITDFNKQCEIFTRLHTIKGCNKEKVKVTPDWACSEFNIGIA